LQKASSQQHNSLKDGFYAKTPAEEIKCADLELNELMSLEDVTARVNGAVKPGMSPDAASKARDTEIANIEKESKEKTALRSDVITLYQGGPGRADRQFTVEFAYHRDIEVPKWLTMV
jgi:hypothetical protein